MSEIGEIVPVIDSVAVLKQSFTTRYEHLNNLAFWFGAATTMLNDSQWVHDTLANSARPELVITDPIELPLLTDPHSLKMTTGKGLNNFPSYLTRFGTRIENSPSYGANLRQLSHGELQQYLFLGARGDYDQVVKFAEENGIDDKLRKHVVMETCVNKPAFMRMWMLFPDFTEWIIRTTLDSPENEYHKFKEEIFVAHTLMSRLVDRKDPNVIREDGSLNDYYLGN